MKEFFKIAAIVGITGAGFLLAGVARAGGDSPFPLVGEDESVALTEVWQALDDSKVVKLYKSDTGETYLVLETKNPKKIELLRKIK